MRLNPRRRPHRQQPRVGDREWRARFERDRAQFERRWPVYVALSLLAALTLIVLLLALLANGLLPYWLILA